MPTLSFGRSIIEIFFEWWQEQVSCKIYDLIRATFQLFYQFNFRTNVWYECNTNHMSRKSGKQNCIFEIANKTVYVTESKPEGRTKKSMVRQKSKELSFSSITSLSWYFLAPYKSKECCNRTTYLRVVSLLIKSQIPKWKTYPGNPLYFV